ncbi:MAG: glycosyltransferase family 4 protein [Anaerolineales bacterium]|jgi:glycosyltransferase involved in cell wall biosynthesis
MRVLYFTRDYTPHDYRFLAALAETQHQVFYLRLERRGQQLEDRPLPPQIEQVTWSGGRAPARLQDAPRLLAGLRRVIRKVKPDLTHAGPIQTSALLAALSGFRPLVSMSWGSDLLRDASRSAAYRWATRYTLARSDALIVDCEPVRQKALEFGMPEQKIVSFPWGVDLEHFSPANGRPALFDSERQDSGERTFTLLSTRGWEPIYGVDVIARAFVQAARQRPGLRLIMLGGGSQAALLHEIFTRGGVQERVLLPGQVSQDDLPRYYRASDLYVSASHSDGTSISLLEAMASGTPCLVSDIPGNREWVEPEVQGWWFPDGDAGALAQTVLTALQTPDRLAQMGRAARRTAEQRADWEHNFRKLLQAYEMARRAQR